MSNPSYPDDCPAPGFDPVRPPMPTDDIFLDHIAWQMYIVSAKLKGISDPFRWNALHRGAQNHWREIAFDKVMMWARDDAETVNAVNRNLIFEDAREMDSPPDCGPSAAKSANVGPSSFSPNVPDQPRSP